MKKLFAVLLVFWFTACTATPSPNSSMENSPAPPTVTQVPVTATPSLTPWMKFTLSVTPAPIVIPATLVIPTLQTGQSVNLLSIQMIDAQTGWAIQEAPREVLRPGSRTEYPWPPEGYILRTTDGGKSWQASQPFIIAEGRAAFYLPSRMQFIDRNTGWLLTLIEPAMNGAPMGEALFRTTDGGNTWERINSFLGNLDGYGNGGLAFSDTTTGWYGSGYVDDGKVIIPFSTLFKQGGLQVRHTIDGGMTFSWDTLLPTPSDLQELAASSLVMDCGENRVIAFTPEVVGIDWGCINYADRTRYRYFSLSTDTGRTWNTWKSSGNEYFFDASHGWRLLSPGQLQQTMDSGSTWVTIKTVAWENAQFNFTSEQEGGALVTSAEATALVHTADGGKTWEEIKPVIAAP